MKILLTYENRIRHDSTGIYFQDAFSKIADVLHVYNEQLEYIDYRKFDLCVKIDDGLEQHRFPKEYHPSVYYAIDTHIHPDWRLKLAEESEFDYIFCAQKPGTELDWHTHNVHWLPLACDPNVHYCAHGRYKQYDVCFVGNVQPFWQKRRVERLDRLFKSIPNYFFDNRFFREATEIYSASKLVFNSAYSNDINMRVFEAMCSGSCLFTDHQQWEGMFVDCQHLLEYKSEDEMIERAKYYTKYDDEREEIARHGQMEVLSKHTYLHRAKEILKIATG